MLWVFLLLLLVVLLVVLDQRKCKKTTTLYEQTKTEHPYVPFIGHLYMFVGNNTEFMRCINNLAHQAYKNTHGVASIWMGPNWIYPFVSDAEPAKLVLKYCLDKGHLIKLSRHLLGNGSIFAPVDIWRPRRKILSRAIAPKNVKIFFDVFVRNSHVVVEKLESVAGKGDFPLWNYISNCSLNIACETIYGDDLQLQKKVDHPFVNAFVEYFKNIGARLLQFWLHSDSFYKLLPVYKTQSDMKAILHEFTEQLIKKGKKALQAQKSQEYNSVHDIKDINIKKERSFLDLLINFSGSSKEYTDVELMEETLVLLLAATDTTASSSCFTLLLLSQYPDVQDKVYNELYEVFGDTESDVISINDISKLAYLDAVVKESLRLYPAVPIIVRKCEKDFELPSGLVVCENTEVVTNIWGILRNPKHWGADANQFKPERFLSATPEQLSAFIPFSYGNRNCVGGWYAMHSLKVLLVSILRRYRVKPATSYAYEEDKGFRVKFDVILKHVDNFEVQMERRV